MSYIEEAIKTATTGEHHRFQGDADYERQSMLAELARLRAVDARAKSLEIAVKSTLQAAKMQAAEAEAWRAVRERWEQGGQHYGGTCEELQRQIARLDQLAAPTPTGGE